MSETDLATEYPVTYIGPTWQRTEDGKSYRLPKKTLGWEIAGWCSEYLCDPNSPEDDPRPFRFTNEQMRFILWWYEVDDTGRFVSRSSVFQRLKGWGKDPMLAVISLVEFVGPSRFSRWGDDGEPVGKPHGSAWVQVVATSQSQPLALDTRVLTTDGWKTMGSIAVGDRVFDEHGNQQVVARETEVFHGEDCYRITFDDGQQVVASSKHGWTVRERSRHDGSYKTVTVDTEYLSRNHRAANGGRRIKLPCAPVKTKDIDLPVDPYILGYWLGDGSKSNGAIAVGDLDLDATVDNLSERLMQHEEIRVKPGTGCNIVYIGRKKSICPKGHEKAGDNVYTTSQGSPGCRKCQRQAQVAVDRRDPILPSLMERLRAIGVLNNKHVPVEYLTAGTGQRLDLLRGLLDSDGFCAKDGTAGFTNKNPMLIEAVVELARSLGYKPFVSRADSDAQVVKFKTTCEHRLFLLDRKHERQVHRDGQFRWIESVEKVDSVPVKCIGIDTDSHLFQVEGGLLTHNTTNTFELFPRLMSEQFKAHYNVTPGAELIRGNGGRCRIQAVTSSYRSLEGGRVTFTLLNETQHWVQGNGGIKMFETIQSNATKGGNRMVSITNAFLPGEDSVAEKQRLAYEDIIEGRAPDTGFLYDSIEAHPGTPMTPEGVRYAIPLLRGDSVWLNPEDVIAEVMKTDTPVARSRRMWFNQILASEDALYQQDDWDKLAVNTNPLRPGDEIVLGFDGGKSFDATALVAIRVKDSYVQPLLIEERPAEWPRDAHWEVDREKVDSVVHHAFRTYKVSAMYADVALWESYLANWAAEYGRSAKVKSSASRDGNPFAWNMAGGGRRVTASHELLMQTILDEGLKHGPNAGLNASLRRHLLNARRMETSTGVSFGKESRRSPKKVDAYAALMLANQALTDLRIKAKPERERTGRAWFI